MPLQVELEGWKTDTCKFCGAKIIWSTRSDGKGSIPLDPKAPIFAITGPEAPVGCQVKSPNDIFPYADRGAISRLFVSHFSTCPAKTKAWALLKRAYPLLGQPNLREEIHAYLTKWR